MRNEVGQVDGGIVGRGPGPAHARGHEDGTGQDRGGFEQELVTGRARLRLHAQPETFKSHLAHDKTPKVALGVDVVRVPFSEAIVGALVDGMIEVIAPGVECQFIE